MNEVIEALATLEERASGLARGILGGHALRGCADDDLVDVLAVTSRVQRLLDAALIEAVGELSARSASTVTEARLSARLGCHNVAEVVQRVTRVAPPTATRLIAAAKAVRENDSPTTGELLDPALPALRAALAEGAVGLDGALAISSPLLAMGTRAPREAVLAADEMLAAEARGEGPDAAPPACADLLRLQAQVWAVALDPDGAEPRERSAAHARGFVLGTATARGVPVRGHLLPEVAAQFQRICDAALSPRVDAVRFVDPEAVAGAMVDDIPADPRTRAQKQHDVLAMALSVAASSESLPTIGGAAPTLIVSAREEDLVAGSGHAFVEGTDEPVSIAAAVHAACAGVIQRVVLSRNGRIHSLGAEERVFTRRQRRAIAERDGGCIIPGCGVPAGWCEIHHVEEFARGGPTHTDNGVLVCWYHHRFLDFSGWTIRMNRGVPEVRAPLWFDAQRIWRPATRSRTRMLDAVLRR